MNSRERVLCALDHKEPDRIPFDISSTGSTEIALKAYRNLLSYLGIKKKVEILTLVAQRACVDETILKKLNVDTRGIHPNVPIQWKVKTKEDDHYTYYQDGWGIIRKMPKIGGLYYDITVSPLSNVNTDDIEKYPWPNPTDPVIFQGLKEKALRLYKETDAALVVGRTFGNGILTMGGWLEGYENWFCDLISNPTRVNKIMDKILELKMEYWNKMLTEIGDYVDIVVEYDDLGAQDSLLISPELYRKYVKPRQKELFDFIKRKSSVYVFFHSDGAIYDLIPDLIEVGIDILNPIQIGLLKMNGPVLKKEFGKYLSFWGGGIDTQHTLPNGTTQEVKDEVKKRIQDLSPCGGFIFATVHAIQADVPPENIMSMWESLQENGLY
jgi:uroporphyrinogen decarboxylase